MNSTHGTITNDHLDALAKDFRYIITDMICRAGSGHLGGALSLVEIIITLYYRIMKVEPQNPLWEERDRLVLSKGHAGPVLYVALSFKGFFPKSWLGTLNKDGTRLPSHVDRLQTPGVDMTAGSLGQGLSCACGMALAAKKDGKTHRIFCIIGDGESNEGQIWEAALFAGHHKLDNLIAICDYNKLQIDGRTDEVLTLEPLANKWRSFNWEVFEMDGHDWDAIYDTITRAIQFQGKPKMIIAHTIKAKCHCQYENQVSSHNIKVPDEATYRKVMEGIPHDREINYCED
ncbi:MAG: transketolase [Spirochaetes bacterium]|nr:transketolase [Spirochaetota bacterium]